jgi:hypothetical protein
MKPFKKVVAIMAFAGMISTEALAQEEIDQYLRESVADGEKLIGAYISPAMNALSSGLNQGWYNTAKPHKIAGFDLTFTFNAMTIPTNELFYDVSKLNLQNIELDQTSPDYTPSSQKAPTIFGPERAPVFRIKAGDDAGQTFDGPGGIDLKQNLGADILPVPIAHIAFGLPKGTEVKLRFLPKLDLGEDLDFNMFGIGILHDVKQWIPGIKSLPFDLSAFAGYTKMKLRVAIAENDFRENTRGEFNVNAATIQGIISKKISILTVYGGLGYNVATSKIGLLGSYDINQDGDYLDSKEVNPVALSFSASGPRMTAGFRLKLAVITLHADYTMQKYNCLTAGFGINVR